MFIFKYVTKHPKLQSDIFRHFDVIEKMEQSRGGEEEKEKLFLSPWRRRDAVQGCQIFLSTTYQNGKNMPNDHTIYQMATKYTKWPQNISNASKVDQMVIKCTIFHCMILNHLATLVQSTLHPPQELEGPGSNPARV
jgi:hypothetical protein